MEKLTSHEVSFVAYLGLGYSIQAASSVLFPKENPQEVFDRLMFKLGTLADTEFGEAKDEEEVESGTA